MILYNIRYIAFLPALQESDSGQYVCEAYSDSGSSKATCALLVVGGTESRRISPHQTPVPPNPNDVPGAPTRPRVVNVTSAGVTLAWDASTYQGKYPLLGYRVSVFTAGWSIEKTHNKDSRSLVTRQNTVREHKTSEVSFSGWVPIHKPMIVPRVYIDLIADHPRIVVVRAFNNIGDSEPSPWSPLLKASEIGENPKVRTERLKPLTGTLVNLTSVTAVPPDALRITWKVCRVSKALIIFIESIVSAV